MSAEQVAIDSIVVEGRCRKDFGDITGLMESIENLGLLQPIVLTPDHRLVAGERRLEAFRRLGFEEIPAVVVTNLTTAQVLLEAERDENTCRKDLTPSEMYTVGQKLEEILRPQALGRMGTRTDLGHFVPPGAQSDSGDAHKTRDAVASALGIGHSTYDRIKTVVEATNDPDPEVARVAQEAAAEMDATGLVRPLAERVARAKAPRTTEPRGKVPVSKLTAAEFEAKVRPLAEAGMTSRQIAAEVGVTDHYIRLRSRELRIEIPADAVVGRTRRIDSNRVIDETVNAAQGAAFGLTLVNFDDLDRSRISGWVDSLTTSIRSLNQILKTMKELTPNE